MDVKGKAPHCTFYGKMMNIAQSIGSGSGSRVEGETDDDRRNIVPDETLIPGLNNDVALMCMADSSRSDYGSLLRLNTKFYALIKGGYLYEMRRQMGIEEHWVYMASGPTKWDAFDPYTNKWMTLPKIPCDDCFNFSDKESLAVGTELIVFGREIFEFSIWKYSIISRDWSRCENMTHPRCLFGSASIDSIVVVPGGCEKNGNTVKSAELYNSITGKWEILPCMHTPRRLCSGVFMDCKFYVIGGMTNATDWLACGEEFDLETRKWRKIEGMYPYEKSGGQAPPLVAVVDNELYAVEYLTNMVKKYNKEKNLWEDMGRIPIRADSSNGWGLAVKSWGDTLLIVGGARAPGEDVIVLSFWDPKSGGNNGVLDWYVLGLKERSGVFVFNCAVMGC